MNDIARRIADLIDLHDYCGRELQKPQTDRDRKMLLDTRRECCEEIEALETPSK